MLALPMASRPHLDVELNNGIWFNDVVLHDIRFFDVEEVVRGSFLVGGGWFSFCTPELLTFAVITDVDFDDIYEIGVCE